MQQLQQYAAIAGLVGFFVLMIWYVMRQKAKMRAAFGGFAEKHGLQFTDGAYPSVTGKVDGRHTLLRSRREPRQQLAFFQIQVGVLGELPRGVLVSSRGRFDSSGIQTGDADFDSKVRVVAPDPAAFAAWLNPARRAALLKVAAGKHAFVVPADAANETGAIVMLDQPGFKSRLDWFEEKYQQILEIARQLDA